MVYLLIIICIIVYSKFLDLTKTTFVNYALFFTPVFLLLVMALGLQNNVGTDYDSYYRMAEGSKDLTFIENKSEQLFLGLIYLVRMTGIPQLLFIFTAFIQVTFLILISYDVKKLGWKLEYFFLLYFSLSLVFFNQFNGIRQYIAVYIVVYAILKLFEKKALLFLILVVIAGFFHLSAFVFILLLPLSKLLHKKLSLTFILISISALLVINLMDITGIIRSVVERLPIYSSYINSSYMRRMDFAGIITKLPKLAIVIFALITIHKTDEAKKHTFLINMSYIASAVMIMSFSSTVIWRFYQYFDLFLIFPVLIMMQNSKKKLYSILTVCALLVMLAIKIILMPEGEYLYRSILFG